ncbi:response regulator [Aliivibrio fischeri]|uniref:Alpha/beta hydrolase n=1 Tax=Aliivibrio fischeri TaxID=668 RepID=A0A844P613_ALIFS|nr:response regulator [Aliivibrio fischeri]MUK50780.1 alpha/beta hydrolase [Aliivibrio fischeri]
MKILVADDNDKRALSIYKLICDEFCLDDSHVHIVNNSEAALARLRRNKYDVLILDVVFKSLNNAPDCRISYDILNKIATSVKYNKPLRVIGITAHLDDIGKYREEFNKYCFCLIEASNSNLDWKRSILTSINYEYKKLHSTDNNDNTLCLTVHGIRTKGRWQKILENKIKQEIGDIKVLHYSYGFFDIISFFVPIFRYFTTYRFKKKLEICLDNNKDKDIYLFCHSFGTYLVVKSLEKILKTKYYDNIKILVLSGSVLKSSYDFNNIIDCSSATVVNDCGESDYVLTASQLFVPNMGMAGKVGFYGFNNERIVNRHFDGGHSHYFDENSKFIDKYWLPLFYDKNEISHIDMTTRESYFNSILDTFAKWFGKFKEVIYLTLILYLVYVNFV